MTSSTFEIQNSCLKYLKITCFLFQEFSAFTLQHKSQHLSSDIVYSSIAPVNFAPGVPSSVSSTISPSFLFVIASLLAIIISFSAYMLMNHHLKSTCGALLHLITPHHYLLQFLPMFCFSKRKRIARYLGNFDCKDAMEKAAESHMSQ